MINELLIPLDIDFEANNAQFEPFYCFSDRRTTTCKPNSEISLYSVGQFEDKVDSHLADLDVSHATSTTETQRDEMEKASVASRRRKRGYNDVVCS